MLDAQLCQRLSVVVVMEGTASQLGFGQLVPDGKCHLVLLRIRLKRINLLFQNLGAVESATIGI